MKRFWNIVLCVLSVVPLIAQEDYYFTLLDHWNWKGPNTYVPTNLKKCAVSLCAAEDVDFTFSTPVNNGQTTIHVNQGNNSVVMIDDVDAAILNGVSIHSSGASSININIIGTTSAAETAVLPKRLLGTKYMVQGAPGLLVDNLPVYSQFTVVGIENGSSIRVKPRVAMTCVTTGATVPAGQVSNFQINEKQVLLFQPVNYEDEISGTVVESDRKIAVFQGNNITRIPVTANWSDFVYEQARPISSWGKEFIIPKASGLIICDWKIIAAEDNTEVYIYSNGSKVKHGVKNAGEWFTKTIYSASSDLQVDHIVTSKPVCCYLYMTGSSSNNSKGDPEMIEIVPVDKMATEARWGKAQTNDNTPHTISLLVTAPQADETKVQYNSQPLSSYATQSGVQRVVIDGFVVYQIPFATANGVLQSAGEGFSAHIIHYAQTAEGTGYNVSLPEEMPEPADLCMDGTLLFREDFGGNDPSDPAVNRTPVPGMSSGYTQIYKLQTSDPGVGMGSGCYLVAKRGYRNSTINTYSVWHIMDDHTHFGDTTRGYLLEIDGKGSGNDVFYSTTIDGLCAGSKLTFSAYVANLTTAGQYAAWRNDRSYVHPKLSFILTNPTTGTQLARYNTDTISHDWSNYPKSWRESADWQLIGMNFMVPAGINAIQLRICNNASGSSTGNDFALDDIEIRLCMPPVSIVGDAEVCENSTTTLTADFTNDGTLTEPLEYKWWHSEDSLIWTEIPGTSVSLSLASVGQSETGWYKVAVAGAGSISSVNCRSISEPFKLSVKECEPPEPEPVLCTDGILLFREDFGGNDAGDSEISCAHVSGIANFYTNACQEVRKHPEYGMSTMNYVLTKKGQGNRQWHVQDDHTYPNDYTRGYFLEVDGYGGTIYKTTVNNLYEGMELTFSAYIANLHDSCVIANMRKNYGYTYPRFKFILKDAESNAELATYTTGNILPDITMPCVLAKSALWQLKGMKYVVPEGVSSIQMLINNDVASYDGNDFGIDDIEIRLCYMPAKKIVQDTIICDTIDAITWRNKIYPLKNELRDTVYDSSGADSIYYILNVIMEHCCPEIKEKTITIGTLCDTLLPYTLYFRDTVLTFKMAGDVLLEIQHPQWDCIDSIYILHLDTMHCEQLYPIIVNKYNWQLLCHNVRVRELFPELTVTGYQWYKDGTAIPNATEDDYSEQNELQGAFQLRLLMSDGRYVWSEILTIQPSQTQAPSRIRIYNHNGYLFYQSEKETTIPSLPRGLYIIQIEQNGEQRIEKKLIP
jgi:hypothetical protein